VDVKIYNYYYFSSNIKVKIKFRWASKSGCFSTTNQAIGESKLKKIVYKLIGTVVILIFMGVNPTYGAENASNPLASVNNTDIRYKYFDLDGPELNQFSLDGSYMVTPKLKLKYELHYWDTDVTGKSENDWESLHVKPLYFPKQGVWGSWKYKLAIGAEWIVGFGHENKGIGLGSDQIAPLAGIALMPGGGLVLIPLIQHYIEYSGPDVNTTAFRLVALQAFPNDFWAKLDAKMPVDWEHDNDIPATCEVQVGKMFTPGFGAYVDGLVGIGGDKPYDWGVGTGLRFNY
jgi:hypothetical protein